MGFDGLDIALSGLNIAQQQLNLISSNIANASTPGYSRKVLPQEGVVIAGKETGVRGGTIVRNVNVNVLRDYWTQISSVNSLDIKAKYLDNIQQFHGPPEAEISVAAELSDLRDQFSLLSDSPEDTFLLRAVVEQAVVFADKINSLEDLITRMRNDAQDEMRDSIESINSNLQLIADVNQEIKAAISGSRSTASLEDTRDRAVKSLSEEIEVDFFIQGDGMMVVQTTNGAQLADHSANTLTFKPASLGVSSYYPESANGVYVGDPVTSPFANDITQTNLGGRLGALIELRDDILPSQVAMLDEMAHQVSRRFDTQGLRLFTDANNQIRADTAPDPDTDPPTAVAYVGLSNEFRVNQAVLNNNQLIQTGTAALDKPLQGGSNQVIRRVLEYTFGDVAFQQATGNVDLRVSGVPSTLQTALGIHSEARVTSDINLASFTGGLADIVTNADGALDDPDDLFDITFSDPDLVNAPISAANKTISVDISAAIALTPGGNAAEQLQAYINQELAAGTAIDPAYDVNVNINTSGQLVITSRSNIVIDSTGANRIGQTGLDFLGLTNGTTEAEDPYFDVIIGSENPVRVTIEPLDDESDLYDKLDFDGSSGDAGVPGLAVDTDLTAGGGNGFLNLRPGGDPSNPDFGGDMTIIGGPFETAGGAGIIEGLFGSANPVSDVAYGSPDADGNNVAFRTQNLGGGANISTGVVSSRNLIDFGQKIVKVQTDTSLTAAERRSDEDTFRGLLEERINNESGVNVEEELANLIRIQTSFTAASRVVQAIDEQFQDFLSILR